MKNDFLIYQKGEDGVAIITLDQANSSQNLFTGDFVEAYAEASKRAIEDSEVKGVIVTSAKSMFMPGGDLNWLLKSDDPKVFFETVLKVHQYLRYNETAGKPFVAVLNGSALGGGMEIAISCHHRIAISHPKSLFGFPEVKLGLLPGGGGNSKAPYLMGLEKGLTYLVTGKNVNEEEAKEVRLIDNIVEDLDTAMASAKQWVSENPNPVQPWDDRKNQIHLGGLLSNNAQLMIGNTGNIAKTTHGNIPAAQYILSIVHDGIQIPIDRALELETRYFTKAVFSKEAKNMIRTGFIGMQNYKKNIASKQTFEPFKIDSIANSLKKDDYITRCIMAYCCEGMALLEEGVPPAMIENITKKIGMPIGPLEVVDHITFDLFQEVIEMRDDCLSTIKTLKDQYGQNGFYEITEEGRKQLWRKLPSIFNSNQDTLKPLTIEKRIMYRLALEAYSCLEEGLVESVTYADLGSVIGLNFPIPTGGALSYIEYIGNDEFVAECDEFKQHYGDRFNVPESLRELVKEGSSIHDYNKILKA